MRQPLPLQSYQLASVQSSPERLVNCFIEQMPPGGKGPVKLGRSEGITTFVEVGDGPIIEIEYVPAFDKIFVVSGVELYSVTQGGVVALIGTVGSSDRVSMSHNDESVAVVVSPNMYTWNGTVFAQVTDVDFTAVGALDIQYLDGYLTFTFPDSASFGAFDLGSSSSYDALSFSTEDGDPDFLVGHISDHRQLMLAGTRSMGLWDNTGAAGFPFERAINGYVEIGCANGRTLAKSDNTIFWLGNDKTFRKLAGAIPERVSQHGVEDQLSSIDLSTGKSFGYALGGHLFYVCNFDTRTFVYDATTQLWHERKSYGENCWRASCHTQAWNTEYVGDRTSNKVGYLDPAARTEFGDPLVMQWTYQPVYLDRKQVTHNSFELILDSGNGIVVGQGSDPEVMLEFSNNSGKTWTFLPNKKIGRLGEYDIGVRWTGLGSSPNRVYRASISDPVPVNVVDTQIDITPGRAV